MATTRIMPLHVGKGRTESRAISDIIDYVANPKKTDDGRLITGYACDSRTVDAEFLLAKRQYIAATGRVRGADDVIAYHVRQSFRPGEITPEEANRLGVEFAKRFTKGNHAFVVCTHIDKSHIPCLKDSSILKEDTLIIVEASLDTSFDYLSELGFTLKKLKTYKTNVHAFITKAE